MVLVVTYFCDFFAWIVDKMDVEVLMKKGQRGAAAYIQECCRSSRPENLNKLLDKLLDPSKPLKEFETIEWLKWLMAGGCTPDEFAATGTKLHLFKVVEVNNIWKPLRAL